MNAFENLERLNAQVDIWIDEEEYERVHQALPITNDGLRKNVDSCLEDPYCTKDKDTEWDGILHRVRNCPIQYAYHQDLTRGKQRLNKHWSRLFYAKLLRARIQQKGTDCYLRRLDEVVAYLENHMPSISPGNEAQTKLAVLYLLELSAASKSLEILAFADRAHRVMRERPDIFGNDGEKFRWFYDLLARYNKGVGHFHNSRYREAIQEFNYIIEQVHRAKKEAAKAGQEGKTGEKTLFSFFTDRWGSGLLYLPAVLYRASVQLKLQLAYQSVETLDLYAVPLEEISDYKRISMTLIEAEAYRQMGRLENAESWERLADAYRRLSSLEQACGRIAKQRKFRSLSKRLFGKKYQRIKGRFLDIYVEDHLQWLEQSPASEGQGRVQCSRMLQNMLHPEYFEMVRFHARSRNGYYQQLAKLMAWLVGTKNKELVEVANDLYQKRGSQLLSEPAAGQCPFCGREGADLKRIMTSEHYRWLKKSMLDFFKDFPKSVGGELDQSMNTQLKVLVDTFLEQERDREDLRIADLDLRYKLKNVRDQMEKDYECPAQRLFPAFDRLLGGTVSDKQSKVRRDLMQLNSGEYQRIMTQWDEGFLRRLQSESNQGGHKRGLYLIGLRRWNSSSPAQGRSVGGGYLLYHTGSNGTVDLGIAIDPGFDFVRNLFHEGFSISDIDIILISHSHVDHVRDFESMVQLLADLKKAEGNKRAKCVHVMLSLGVYKRLKHIIEDPFYRYHVEPYIIDARREIEFDYFEKLSPDYAVDFVKPGDRDDKEKHERGTMRYRAVLPGENLASRTDDSRIKVTVEPTRAYHTDPSNYSDSFGFKIKVTERDKRLGRRAGAPSPHTTTLGYTGDTRWVYPCVHDPLEGKDNRHQIYDVSEQYAGCDAVIVHLGSLVGTNEEGLRKKFMNCLKCGTNQKGECRDIVCDKDHPYLAGLIRLLSSLRSESRVRMKTEGKLRQLVLVSEFGEELRGGIRVDLLERLGRAYKDALKFLTLDVGIDVQLLHWEKGEDDKSVASNKQNAWCIQCERFVAIDDAEFERYGVDEALFCVCHTCRKATPLNVMQDRMRQLYEVGRDLRTLDE